MCTMCSQEIFTKKCRQQQNFDSDPKEAWHCNHVTFPPIAKTFMLYFRLIYVLFMQNVSTYDQNKGEDTRVLQNRMIPSQNDWVESPQ